MLGFVDVQHVALLIQRVLARQIRLIDMLLSCIHSNGTSYA